MGSWKRRIFRPFIPGGGGKGKSCYHDKAEECKGGAVKIPRSLLLGRGEHDLKSSYEPLHASVKKRKERVATCVVLLCGNTC